MTDKTEPEVFRKVVVCSEPPLRQRVQVEGKTADEWASELDITVDHDSRFDDKPSATCNNAAEVIHAAQVEAYNQALDNVAKHISARGHMKRNDINNLVANLKRSA